MGIKGLDTISHNGTTYDIQDTKTYSLLFTTSGDIAQGDKSNDADAYVLTNTTGYRHLYIKFTSTNIAHSSSVGITLTLLNGTTISYSIPSYTTSTVKYWIMKFDCIGNNMYICTHSSDALGVNSIPPYYISPSGIGITGDGKCYCKTISAGAGLSFWDADAQTETVYGSIAVYGILASK